MVIKNLKLIGRQSAEAIAHLLSCNRAKFGIVLLSTLFFLLINSQLGSRILMFSIYYNSLG